MYILVEKQNNGCDYTIQCEVRITELKAKTKEEAVEEAIGLEKDWKETIIDDINEYKEWEFEDFRSDSDFINLKDPDYYDELAIDEAYLLEVNEKIPLNEIILEKQKMIKGFIDEQNKKIRDEKEKELYKKLKEKYEGLKGKYEK
jgi:hypothetical protein